MPYASKATVHIAADRTYMLTIMPTMPPHSGKVQHVWHAEMSQRSMPARVGDQKSKILNINQAVTK
jgi:hypothetical protein